MKKKLPFRIGSLRSIEVHNNNRFFNLGWYGPKSIDFFKNDAFSNELRFKDGCDPELLQDLVSFFKAAIDPDTVICAVPPAEPGKATSKLKVIIQELAKQSLCIDGSDCLKRIKRPDGGGADIKDVLTYLLTIEVTNTALMRGKNILVLDLIMTKGSVFKACQQLISQAGVGAKSVTFIALAKTIPNADYGLQLTDAQLLFLEAVKSHLPRLGSNRALLDAYLAKTKCDTNLPGKSSIRDFFAKTISVSALPDPHIKSSTPAQSLPGDQKENMLENLINVSQITHLANNNNTQNNTENVNKSSTGETHRLSYAANPPVKGKRTSQKVPFGQSRLDTFYVKADQLSLTKSPSISITPGTLIVISDDEEENLSKTINYPPIIDIRETKTGAGKSNELTPNQKTSNILGVLSRTSNDTRKSTPTKRPLKEVQKPTARGKSRASLLSPPRENILKFFAKSTEPAFSNSQESGFISSQSSEELSLTSLDLFSQESSENIKKRQIASNNTNKPNKKRKIKIQETIVPGNQKKMKDFYSSSTSDESIEILNDSQSTDMEDTAQTVPSIGKPFF